LIEKLRSQDAARSSQAIEEPEQAPGEAPRAISAAELSEVQRLADELQKLAESTQLLVSRFQATGDAG
jgi:hypothetical protein